MFEQLEQHTEADRIQAEHSKSSQDVESASICLCHAFQVINQPEDEELDNEEQFESVDVNRDAEEDEDWAVLFPETTLIEVAVGAKVWSRPSSYDAPVWTCQRCNWQQTWD